MKKCFSLLLSILLALSLCPVGVYAEENPGSTIDGGVVTGFAKEQIFASLTMDSYQKGDLGGLYDLLNTIDNALGCTVAMPDGSRVETACTAEWNMAELTLDTAGIYNVIATLIPPKGCTFGNGVRTRIVVPVQILDANGIVVTIVTMDDFIKDSVAVAVPTGSTPDNLAAQLNLHDAALTCYDQNGGKHCATILWDDSTIDLQTAGVYHIQGTPQPPAGTVFDGGLVLPKISAAVSVQAKGKPDINCFYRGRGEFRFPWVLTPEQAESRGAFEAWLCTDGVWEKLEDGHYIGEEYFSVALRYLPLNKPCQLQVTYPGGQTGVLTFTYDSITLDSDYSEGDRDGGDSDGNKPPTITQPPPAFDGDGNKDNNGSGSGNDIDNAESAPSPTPNPEPTPPSASVPETEPTSPADGGEQSSASNSVPMQEIKRKPPLQQTVTASSDKDEEPALLERIDETSSTLSGVRLQMMLNDGGVSFAKQGVNCVLSKEAIDALPIADDSVFIIEIKRESKNAFSFTVMVDNTDISELAGTKITLPYTSNSEASAFSVRHNNRQEITSGHYQPEQGLISFMVDAAGSYTILEEETPIVASPTEGETSQQTTTLILTVSAAVVCLLVLTAVVFFLKRRRVK